MQQLLGQPRAQGQGGHVLHHPIQIPHAARLQREQGLAKLGVFAQQLAEHPLGHAQHRGGAVCMCVIGVGAAVQHLGLAHPNARLHIGQRDLFARRRGAPKPDGATGATEPVLSQIALFHNHLAVGIPRDAPEPKDVMPQRRCERGKPAPPVDGLTLGQAQKRLLLVAACGRAQGLWQGVGGHGGQLSKGGSGLACARAAPGWRGPCESASLARRPGAATGYPHW